MSELSSQEAAVGRHYDETIFAFEAERLVRHCPVEYAITTRYLQRYIPDGAVVTEAGVGVGHYSELLARRGCRLYLVDIAERLLQATMDRLRAAGLAGQILGAYRASATRVDGLGTASCDAVLLLGPLYHLCALEDRQRAMHEAARVVRPGGLLFAAAINRVAYLRDTFRQQPEQGAVRRAFHAQFVQDGNLDPAHAPPLGFAHLSTAAELRALLAPDFDEVALVGVEAFTGPWQGVLHGLSPESAAAWSALGRRERALATRQLGEILHALHQVQLPADLQNPWLEDALAPGGPRRDAYHAPPDRYHDLLEAAEAVPGIDRSVLREVESFIAERLDAFSPQREPEALVHADAHFGNLLWDNGRISALLDFEGARPAPPDLELDTSLRFAREPELYDWPSVPVHLTRRDLVGFVDEFVAAYPALFSHPRLDARLGVYEALWHLVQLQHFPPDSGGPDPWAHLLALLEASERWSWR